MQDADPRTAIATVPQKARLLVNSCLLGLTCWRMQCFEGQLSEGGAGTTWMVYANARVYNMALVSMSAVGSHLLQNAGADSNKQQQAGGVGSHAQLHVAVSIKELGGCGQSG